MKDGIFILFCNPVGTVKLITGILETIFIAIGISKIINYFILRGNNDFLGVWIIYTSFVRINTALQIKNVGNILWICSLIFIKNVNKIL